MPPPRTPLLLAFCLAAGAAGCHKPPTLPALALAVRAGFQPPETCRLAFEGESFELPGDQSRALERLRLRRKRQDKAAIDADQTIPYKCIGFAIFLVQNAGFTLVKAGPIPMRQD